MYELAKAIMDDRIREADRMRLVRTVQRARRAEKAATRRSVQKRVWALVSRDATVRRVAHPECARNHPIASRASWVIDDQLGRVATPRPRWSMRRASRGCASSRPGSRGTPASR
jgi:hypothetical protein